MDKLNGFVAYAGGTYEVSQPIAEAVKRINNSGKGQLHTWEENDIAGRQLTAPIFSKISASNILVADITHLNFNVTFEIAFAIAKDIRVFLIRNKEFSDNLQVMRSIGIYDTLGYSEYTNGDSLQRLLAGISDLDPIPINSEINPKLPVYILETPVRGHSSSAIMSHVKKARLPIRTFNPDEEARLSPYSAIDHVSRSHGVVVPLLNDDRSNADIHNIRAAFIAGLSFGMGKVTLILQDSKGPVPLDVRDLAKIYNRPEEIKEHIHEFSSSVYERIFESSPSIKSKGNLLSRLSIGDPMAENEFQSLGSYYVQTDEYGRAIRGEVNLVVGRKGTGKTALFSQVRNKKRNNRKKNIVIDLKPEGYQLLKMKDDVLDYLSSGAKSHLIVAFWEFLLYLEITYKVLEKDKDRHLYDEALYESYSKLEKLYEDNARGAKGDFSERLLHLSDQIADQYASEYGNGKDTRLTNVDVTNLLHTQNILSLRRELNDYLVKKEEIWLLFDNLDKGWSPLGLKTGEIMILRCLIDAARKIQRDLRKDSIVFHGMIFIRNDVYQLLMDQSPDFGKESRASLDWSDPELLREMLRKRLISGGLPDSSEFMDSWKEVCIPIYKGEETSQFLIDRSLMRPRNFLKLLQCCKGFAVNLRHSKIEAGDIEKGIKTYSNDLLVDADQELTDIEPEAKGAIYEFIGESSEYSREEVELLLEGHSKNEELVGRIIEFLLYYGFLGIRYLSNDPQYIYDVGYDFQLLKTRIKKNKDAIQYILNPAFWPALEIQP